MSKAYQIDLVCARQANQFAAFLKRLGVYRQNMSKTISEIRLLNARVLVEKAGGPAAYARTMGMHSAQANQHVGPNPTRNIGNNLARRIEAAFDVPLGSLDVLNATPVAASASGVSVPVFDAQASMGRGSKAPDYDVVVGGLTLDENWIRQNLGGVTSPKNLGVIPAYGDSMTPTFSDGDLLLVDRGVHEIRLDAVYVLGLNGELFVKRLQRRPNQTILMISDNKAYEPYSIENGERDQFSVLGRVVWAWNGRKL